MLQDELSFVLRGFDRAIRTLVEVRAKPMGHRCRFRGASTLAHEPIIWRVASRPLDVISHGRAGWNASLTQPARGHQLQQARRIFGHGFSTLRGGIHRHLQGLWQDADALLFDKSGGHAA
nr:hypothetical protein [Mesorhizobium sp. CO1-1-7]